MSRNNFGFALFMSLLLFAPKIPILISGGATRSSASLGIVGLTIWYLIYPKKIFYFPRISNFHPLLWMIVFAIYAFLVSLISTKTVSIVYSAQFLLYVILGTVLMKRYGYHFVTTDHNRAQSIFWIIAIIFSIGILISVLTGPIYPHQVGATQRQWAGFKIQHGVGFSEAYNMAAPVAMFFWVACFYMYHGKTWKKWILLTLLLIAFLATLSRGAIVSLTLALGFVYLLDNIVPLLRRASIKRSLLEFFGFFTLFFGSLIFILLSHATTRALLSGVLSGFGLTNQHSIISRDLGGRFNLWAWGLDYWASKSLLGIIFGGGFRSSMIAGTAWKDAHNLYITILGDFGIVGLGLFLAALLVAFFRYANLLVTDKAKAIERFGFVTVLSLGIHNMTGPYLYSPISLTILIFTLAVTIPFVKTREIY